MPADVHNTGKRPQDAYTDMKFKATDKQDNVINQLPSYHEVRCQLSRHRIHSCIPVLDPLCIPDALKTTLRGREALEEDLIKNQRFLLYSGQVGT